MMYVTSPFLKHLRRFCLRRGELPIFYVSSRNGSNCIKLEVCDANGRYYTSTCVLNWHLCDLTSAIDPSPPQRYLLHLLHPNTFSFNDEASLGTEDIFIPSGWDSEALIDSILLEDWAKSSSFNDVSSIQWGGCLRLS